MKRRSPSPHFEMIGLVFEMFVSVWEKRSVIHQEAAAHAHGGFLRTTHSLIVTLFMRFQLPPDEAFVSE